jgi:hypothetical protein
MISLKGISMSNKHRFAMKAMMDAASEYNHTTRLYGWQGVVLRVLAVATFLALHFNYYSKYGWDSRVDDWGGPVAYLLDLGFGIGLNVLILYIVFLSVNGIYRWLRGK